MRPPHVFQGSPISGLGGPGSHLFDCRVAQEKGGFVNRDVDSLTFKWDDCALCFLQFTSEVDRDLETMIFPLVLTVPILDRIRRFWAIAKMLSANRETPAGSTVP
jgi:hypothetical protein